ncbi:MAG TPA: transcription antitermination factor NusB [Candidatus Fimenecus excrementigallinarum]|uniref:Transcription antitermination protein NusB n=1 Tax=Candidatus Fimenecus excrementigallinarum TaxID=2840816 RepID=A0A9D1LDE4_9FIRM|nr:transcription antitermination factor NusB [Candidatus Fimenecus excrementigallinarum]
MTRSEEREQAFILIFEKAFNMDVPEDDLIGFAVETGLLEPTVFSTFLFKQVYEKLPEIDAVIEQYAIGWKKERISKVALSVLRLAICEILFVDSIPSGVSANEAVELAKKYATADDAAYINGILGAFIRGRKQEDANPRD